MSAVHTALQLAAQLAVAEKWDAQKFQDEAFAYFEVAASQLAPAEKVSEPLRGWYGNSACHPRNAGPFDSEEQARNYFLLPGGAEMRDTLIWFEEK